MYRKIYENLLEWKNSSDKKPLMLLVARQVGKTYVIEEFFNFKKKIYFKTNKLLICIKTLL